MAEKQLLSFEPPRGMRDFYPEDMVWRERVFGAWRRSSALCGFSQYDSCVVESLELLQRKAGEEVTEQIYAFQDKGGRNLALRAEMTPTLARMVAQKQGSLRFPLKWSTIAQCFRYERMTRGRKREHYQWNVDIIGEESVVAEVEVLNAAVTALGLMGMPRDAFKVHINSRALLSELLTKYGFEASDHAAVFLALDKRGKITDEAIKDLLISEGLRKESISKVFDLMELSSLDAVSGIVGEDSPALCRLRKLFEYAEIYGINDCLIFDIGVIRGLSYYTGIVFECFDTARKFRAIFGGGRYDNLLTSIGGDPTPAVGLGFGDVVVQEVLKDLLGEGAAKAREGVAIGYMSPAEQKTALALASRLRKEGIPTDVSLTHQKPKQFFRLAGEGSSLKAIYIGPDDIEKGKVRIKNLETRTEEEIEL